MASDISKNLKKIFDEMPYDITLVVATKTRSVQEIEETIRCGVTIIGENYVKEAERKYEELKEKVKIHLIGHLQTNKVKKAVEIFDMIQSVDSFKLAQEIDKRCKEINKVMPILIEVNIGREENKDGVLPEYVTELIKVISLMGNIKVKGLMCMAPFFEKEDDYIPYFKNMKKLFDELKDMNIPNTEIGELSMGMSNSYKIAIKEGTTMVRLGTDIFGMRC